jgi:GNAT superfamily N-acetyltransferase
VSEPQALCIRAATPADASALVPLLGELGYEVQAATLADKLARLCHSADDCVLIATGAAGSAPLGIIACHVLEPLHTPGRLGRITALVVSQSQRRRGVGERLLAAAVAFCRGRGCPRLEVTSATHRDGAHAFYLAAGFEATSRRFVRTL